MIPNRLFFWILASLLVTGTAGGATLNVGQGQDYSTIQSALDASDTGDIISVSEGTYYENILIRKDGILLLGKNKEKTIIDGKKTGSVIRVETNEVTISGFTIQNNGGSGKEDAGVNFYNSNNNMIANSIIIGNTAGVAIYSSSSNNVVAGNIIESNGRYGINVFSSLDNKIYGNQIQKNQIGIYVDSGRGNQIYSNNFIDNTMDQAYDNSALNSWNEGESGNYWNTHKAGGAFNIKGGANAADNYPLSGAVIIKDVAITIPTPVNTQEQETQEEGKKSPGFEVLSVITAIGLMGHWNRK